MRNLLLAGTAGLCLALSAVGAYAGDSAPHYATTLPNFFSLRSPLLASHYGYDDRDTRQSSADHAAAVTTSNERVGG